MAEFLITLTDREVAAVQSLDAKKTPGEILTTHVNTWLAPILKDVEKRELELLQAAYAQADDETRTRVREELLARVPKDG